MATLTPADTHTHDDHHGDYITCSKGIMSWLITLDHKRLTHRSPVSLCSFLSFPFFLEISLCLSPPLLVPSPFLWS